MSRLSREESGCGWQAPSSLKVVDPHSDLLSKASQGVFSVSVSFSRVEARMSGTLKEMFEWITNRKPPLLLPCSLVFCQEMS